MAFVADGQEAREGPRVFDKTIYRSISGEDLDEGLAKVPIFLAGPEEWLQEGEVGEGIDEGEPGELLASALAPQLLLVAREQRGREIFLRLSFVGESRSQSSALHGVTNALAAYRVDQAARVPDE